MTNSVIHTLTRYSENEKQNIDQDMLLDMALRFNPEIICVGEMRSSEAYTAQESARTGHTVLTTIHSNSCESTYSRMRTLCKRKYDMDDEVLMDLVTEAFPIVVFTKQLENRKRKLMEIMECEITADGKRKFNPLYRYEITENRMEGDRFIINVLPEKASCPIPAACSGVGTLPGLRDILSRSGSLRCFPCRGIPFRTVIHFSRCSSSMNYPKSTPKRPPAPYIHKVGNQLGKLSISTLSEL